MARGKKKTNGLGAGGKRFEMPAAAKFDERGHLVVDDLVVATVLVMFFIQKLGQASVGQLAEKLVAAEVALNLQLLTQSIEALRARGFVSYAKGKTSGGEVISQWKARKANFVGSPDVAQVTQSFLSGLVATPDAAEIVGSLNDAEEKGDGEAKAKERLKYADYFIASVTFRTRVRGSNAGLLLGGRPSSPYFDELVKMGPPCPEECNLRFPRDGEGNPVIPISNIRGWLTGMTRLFNLSPALVGYINISGGVIEHHGQIKQWSQPVVDLSGSGFGGGGRGITTYEAIAPGARFTFDFSIPVRGGCNFKQFVAWLIKYTAGSERGLSNARSNEHGFVEVVAAENLGDFRRVNTLQAATRNLSPEAASFAADFMAGLGENFDLFQRHKAADIAAEAAGLE